MMTGKNSKQANPPWKDYFRVTQVYFSQIASKNQKQGLVLSNRDGVFQLYSWSLPNNGLTRVTDLPWGCEQGFIASHGKGFFYFHDEGGNNLGHYMYKDFISGEIRDITPDMPSYASYYFSENISGGHYGFMTADDRGFWIFVYDDENFRKPKFTFESSALSVGPLLSAAGDIAVIMTTERSGSTDSMLLAYDVRTGEKISELWDGENSNIEGISFSRLVGDERLIGQSNASGLIRPFIWDPRSCERINLNIDPIEGNVRAVDWSHDGRFILLLQFHHACQRLWLYDVRKGSVSCLKHPSGVMHTAYFSPDETIYVHIQKGSGPNGLMELDGITGEFRRIILEGGEAPQGREWESVEFLASDGSPVQGWLMLPDKERFQFPRPVILHLHGGPNSVQVNGYDARAQTWAAHGFALLSVNYRGSTTFGRDFQNSINGRLGELELYDIEGAVLYLLNEGIARKDEIFITGWSYGGYLALLGLGRLPQYFRGGIAGAAIADWSLLYEDENEILRAYQRALFGGDPGEKAEAYRIGSPLTWAGKVVAPVLVIQGMNDSTCPERQMRVYEATMKELGKSIDVHWYDAGHTVASNDMGIDHMERMLDWIWKVLS